MYKLKYIIIVLYVNASSTPIRKIVRLDCYNNTMSCLQERHRKIKSGKKKTTEIYYVNTNPEKVDRWTLRKSMTRYRKERFLKIKGKF